MTFVGQLQNKSNITQANIQSITDSIQVFLTDVAQYAVAEVKKLRSCFNAASVETCAAKLQEIPLFIAPVSTKHKRLAYLINKGFFIKPVPIVLETRNEPRYRVSYGYRRQTVVEDTMQYVPLGRLLSEFLVNKKCVALMQENRNRCLSNNKDIDLIAHFFETQTYQQHPYFRLHQNAFALHLYIDAFEVTNPLGSHTAIHKLEGLYLVAQSFSTEHQSKLSSIFLLALWYAQDVKSYGYNKILVPIINSLKR